MATISLHPTERARLRKELGEAMHLRSMWAVVELTGDESTQIAAAKLGLPIDKYIPLIKAFHCQCQDMRITWLHEQLA